MKTSSMKYKSVLDNLKLILLYFVSIVLIIAYVFLIIWTYCYSLYVCYLLIAAFAACTIIYWLHDSKRQAMKFLLLGLGLFALLSPFNIRQFNSHSEALQVRVNAKKELTTKEKLGVYGCVMMITVFDFIPFNEASTENFYLFFPNKEKRRFFNSNAILNSPSILKAVKTNEKGYIGWNKWNYVFNKDFRYAIAFDPCTVTSTIKDGYKEVTLTTYFSYRKNYTTIHATSFLRGMFNFRVDEGLFWYLQDRGWLHPYQAVWTARIRL